MTNREHLSTILKYIDWISVNVVNSYGTCKKYCAKMKKEFPELQIKKGFYIEPNWGGRTSLKGIKEHFWLVDINNKIVDPTKAQYPSNGYGEYIELTNLKIKPTGKCLYCGDYTFNHDTFCCTKCAKLCGYDKIIKKINILDLQK